MKTAIVPFALCLAMLAASAGMARTVPDMRSPETAAFDATIERAELVRDLIARARADRDVPMMIVAAGILGRGEFVLVPAENAPLVLGRARTGEELPVTEPAALLREAASWAAGDSGKLATVEAAQAEANRGILPAAIVYTHDLPAERALTMRARAEGGRLALVRVRGDGDAALELAVTDAAGRTACTAEARRELQCRWTPDRTGEYRIMLRNRGRVWTRAILVSN